MIKLSDYVMKRIAALGVKHVFMLSGGGCMHLVDSLGQNKDLVPVPMLHEQACAIAADAYSQYNEFCGVCLVTTGPGGLNAITGIAASFYDSIPVFVISGQVKRADMIGDSGLRQKGNQETDIIRIVRPIVKDAECLMAPADVRIVMDRMIHSMFTGRPGPVWLDIPLDVQSAQIDETSLVTEDFQRVTAVPQDGAAMELLSQAKRPVLLVGNGVRLAQAKDAMLEVARIYGIPILLTWKAADLVDGDNPFNFGRPGTIANRPANIIQQKADLVIAVGCRLDMPQVAYNYDLFAPDAKKIIVDIDEKELAKFPGKMSNIGLLVRADAGAFLRTMLANGPKSLDTTEWMAECNAIRNKYRDQYCPSTKPGTISTYTLLDVIVRNSAATDVVVPSSSGTASEITQQYFQLCREQRMICSPGLGSMGFGIPAAIGAALASGHRVISIVGDGCLQHNIQELQTIFRLGLNVKIFVLCNEGYASIRNTQKSYFDGRLVGCDGTSGVMVPDVRKIAEAYGLWSSSVDASDMEFKVRFAMNVDGPTMLGIPIDPDLVAIPRVKSVMEPDGKMITPPMDKLWPSAEGE